FVTYKAAMSLDGRTAAADRTSQWITGPTARRDVQRLRAASDAICVGIGTVLADNPSLTVRTPNAARRPLRVVVDSLARTPPGARVLDGAAPTLVVVTDAAPGESVRRLQAVGPLPECWRAGPQPPSGRHGPWSCTAPAGWGRICAWKRDRQKVLCEGVLRSEEFFACMHAIFSALRSAPRRRGLVVVYRHRR